MKTSFVRLYASFTDAALLAAVEADDEGAFAEIYKRYSYRLFTIAYQKLKDREVAEELVQDLFENLWSRRATHQVAQVDAYLFSAIRYRIINYIKAQKVRSGYELYVRMNGASVASETEDTLAANELTAAFMNGIRQLPDKSREVFELSRLQHCTVSEISVRVNLSEKTVEYHLTKSLKLLRQYLRDFLLIFVPWFLF